MIPINSIGNYITKSGKKIKIENNEIITLEGFNEIRRVKIIAPQEVVVPDAFNGASCSTCLILYISSPLNGGIDAPNSVNDMSYSSLSKYISFIFSFPENECILSSLDKFIKDIKKAFKKHKSFVMPLSSQICRRCDETVSYIRNTSAIRTLIYTQRTFFDPSNLDDKKYHQYDAQLRQCIESYIMSNMYYIIY